MDLFPPSLTLVPLSLPDASIFLLDRLDLPWSNDDMLTQLIADTAWRSQQIVLWGKRIDQPRLTAWHGEKHYTYSGLTLRPLPFTALQLHVKAAVEAVTGDVFNSVLLNYYRDGRDSMGMHSDDEPELGPEPVIASVSFGATRPFTLKHKRTKQTVKLSLPGGSLLLMKGKTQACWQHGINKSTRVVGPRVNLTFRNVR